MAWLYLVLAGCLEIGWPVGLKIAQHPGTRWTGIGAAGTFAVGVWLYGDAASVARFAGVALIVGGVITLKLASA